MAVEVVSYGGWRNNVRLSNREIELIVTAEVGPRVIRLGFIGGPNEFCEINDEVGKTGGNEWRLYGGHRLWHAPESVPRTYYPDNHPVEWRPDGDGVLFSSPPEPTTGIAKGMHIRIDADSNRIHVTHTLRNDGAWPVTMAAWALTVMAPGGRVIVPQEPFGPHPQFLLPARPLVVWRYTDMGDPRFTWGRKFIQLRQDRNAKAPLKFGALNTLGWVAYENGGRVFVKRFACQERASYLDYGCNCEFFTNEAMLEVESLSPVATLEPGATLAHEERWQLFRNAELGPGEESIEAAIRSLL